MGFPDSTEIFLSEIAKFKILKSEIVLATMIAFVEGTAALIIELPVQNSTIRDGEQAVVNVGLLIIFGLLMKEIYLATP